jgi:hypothetical protein
MTLWRILAWRELSWTMSRLIDEALDARGGDERATLSNPSLTESITN